MKSWKTTVCGAAGIIAAICTFVIVPLCDADPATLPQWEVTIAAVLAGIGLIAARDNSVTSEKAGAK